MRAPVSMPVTIAIATRRLGCPLRIERIGQAISAGDRGSGRNLIKQRLEGMMILTVDEKDVQRRLGQSPRGFQPAETAADNDHARSGRLFRHRNTPVISGLDLRALHSLTQLSADSVAKPADRLEFRHPRP